MKHSGDTFCSKSMTTKTGSILACDWEQGLSLQYGATMMASKGLFKANSVYDAFIVGCRINGLAEALSLQHAGKINYLSVLDTDAHNYLEETKAWISQQEI